MTGVIYKPVSEKEAANSKQQLQQHPHQPKQQQQQQHHHRRRRQHSDDVIATSRCRYITTRFLTVTSFVMLFTGIALIAACMVFMVAQRYRLMSTDLQQQQQQHLKELHQHLLQQQQQTQQHQQLQQHQQSQQHQQLQQSYTNINDISDDDNINVIENSFEKYFKNGNDETWIFRNFKTGYQTVKSSHHSRQYVCYISRMNLNDQRFSNKLTKTYTTTVYEIIDPPKNLTNGVEALIGQNAIDSCNGVDMIWVQPIKIDFQDRATRPSAYWSTIESHEKLQDNLNSIVEQNQNYDHNDDFNNHNDHNDFNHNHNDHNHNDHNDHNDQDGDHQERSPRVKRNIRSCRTSCCWRVCCCDVHHFIWETVEEFNCNHVCNKCSPRYKSIIQRIC